MKIKSKLSDYPTALSRVGHRDTRVGELVAGGASAFGDVSHHWQPGGRCLDMGTLAKISNFLGIDASCDYDADKFATRAELESWNNWGGGPSLAENPSGVSGTQFAINTKNNVMPGIFAERQVDVDFEVKPRGSWRYNYLTLGEGPKQFTVGRDNLFSEPQSLDWLKNTGFADVFPKEVLDNAKILYEDKVRGIQAEKSLIKGTDTNYPDYHRDHIPDVWESAGKDKVQIGQLLVAVPYEFDKPSRVKPTEWIIDDVKGKGKGLWHSVPSFHNGEEDRSKNVEIHRLFLYGDKSLQADGVQRGSLYADYDGNEIHVGGGKTVNFKGGLFMQAANLNPDLDLDLPPSLV